MPYVLTADQLRNALGFLKSLREYPALPYGEIDLDMTKRVIEAPALERYLPRRASLPLPEKTEAGNYVLALHDGRRLEVPEQFSPLLQLCCARGIYAGSIDEGSEKFLERLYGYFDFLVRLFLRKEKSLSGQVGDIVRVADEIYGELRKYIANLQREEYEGDRLLDTVWLVPDLFVYLCRLLADPSVPKEWKIECALVIAYLIWPYDVIPEALIGHPVAYLDDSVLVLTALKRAFEGGYIDRKHLEEHWPGRIMVLDQLLEWHRALENVLGEETVVVLWQHLVRKIRGGKKN